MNQKVYLVTYGKDFSYGVLAAFSENQLAEEFIEEAKRLDWTEEYQVEEFPLNPKFLLDYMRKIRLIAEGVWKGEKDAENQ